MSRTIKLYVIVVHILSYFNKECYGSINRDITFVQNPNCTSYCEAPWLIYGRGDGGNNSVHYLWSTMGLPTFVIAETVSESQLEISSWDDLQNGINGSVSFTIIPENVFGISFQNLILFNDVNDTGTLDNIPEKDKKYAPLLDFQWTVEKFENVSSNEFVVQFNTVSFKNEPMPNNTKISISVTAFGSEGRSNNLPHLITTSESAQLEITLDNLILDLDDAFENDFDHPKDYVIPISGFDHPRWALDTIIVSSDNAHNDIDNGKGFIYESKKSLDDEHTPGVFDLDAITTPGARHSSFATPYGGYLQWRPVCYLTPSKDINYSTYPNFNTSLPLIDESHARQADDSLLFVLFGGNFGNLLGTQTPIAFGLANDQFYTKYSYTVWTFSMGLGPVPEETFSPLIIVVISVGVGLPCLLFLVGGVYVAIKKLRNRGELLINE